MEKRIKSYYYEVWFSNGKTHWEYDLHDIFQFIRYYMPVSDKMSCVIMYRCDYINSVICPVINLHELRFNF